MFILLSNDDGYLAAGINALASELRGSCGRLAVLAPSSNMSAASHSLTLTRPIAVHAHGNDVYSADGTPADCVHLAVSGYFDRQPDIVLSGINHGANLGDDVMYSGTVAAAFEGRHFGLPAVALSNVSHHPQHLDASAKVAAALFARLRRYPLPAGTLLNVNIPDLPYAQIRGFRTTVLGQRKAAMPLTEIQSPRGQTYYWVGVPGDMQPPEDDSDFTAVEQGFVSVTPLMFDLTHRGQLEEVRFWLEA